MKARKPDMSDIAVAAGVAAAAAVLFGVGLSAWGKPEDFAARSAAVEAKAERARVLLKPARTPARYGAEAICGQSADVQTNVLREVIGQRAAENNLVLAGLETVPEAVDDPAIRLAPVRIRFNATGSYEGAVALLALLARERPQVFVDTLDLTPRAANINLNFSGRVFCAA